MAISRDTVERIRSAVDIVDVVQDFVQLKRRGTVYLGLCPFHNEKTPSFNVNPVLGIFKCFGCGKAGDGITFMMEHEGMSYPEALRYLAGKYGIEVEETKVTTDAERAAQNERESILIALNWAKEHFKNLLLNHEDGKGIGLSYFRERGFTDQIINAFDLGYALDKWDDLLANGTKNGFSQDVLEKGGLLVTKEDGKVFDRFRGRVIFPIHNISGKVIGFGARFLGKDKSQPKYLNSPETAVYKKSEVLYGIFQAKKAIREEDNCYLCEGYTDVISMYQAGIRNSVASSGTALTPDQIRLIGRQTKNITVLYDGDAAGIKASLRGIDLLLEGGMNVRAVSFPEGEDPDSYVRKIGHEAFGQYLKSQAVDFIRFKASLFLDEARQDPIRKTAIVRDMVSSIIKVQDPILRSMYFKTTAQLLDVDEQLLRSEGNKILLQQQKQQQSKGYQTGGSGLNNPPPAISPQGPPPGFQPLSEQTSPPLGGEEQFYNPPPEWDLLPPGLDQPMAATSEGGIPDWPLETPTDVGSEFYLPDTPSFEPDAPQPDLASRRTRLTKLQGDQEREIIRFLLTHTDPTKPLSLEMAQYFLHELHDVVFTNPVYERIYGIFCNEITLGRVPNLGFFMAMEDRELANELAGLMSQHKTISAGWWDKHRITTPSEADNLIQEAFNTIAKLKLMVLKAQLMDAHRALMLATDDESQEKLAREYLEIKHYEIALAEELGQTITDYFIGGALA